MLRRLSIIALLSCTAVLHGQEPLSLTILHTNDLHAHPEPTTMGGKQYGGYARQATLIKQTRAESPNTLLLNAGDCFQGTLYFNEYEGLVECAFMNMVRYDAMCVGNHEFDKGPGALAQFLRYANFPVLAANIDVTAEPLLRGRVSPSAVLTVAGQRIGIVGAVTPDTPSISSPGPTVKFLDLQASVQKAVDALTDQGVNKVILLTHIGYAQDRALVSKLRNVDLVVGGHSHTPLGTPNLPGWPASAGPYPTSVFDSNAQSVPVVQAYEWGKVMGRLRVRFDQQGILTAIDSAEVLVVSEDIPEEPVVASMMAALKMPLAAKSAEKVGMAANDITRVAQGESLMAHVVADGMLEATRKHGAVAALMNSGGVRANFAKGEVTYADAVAVQPFGNSLVVVDLTGSELMTILNQGVPDINRVGGLLHPSTGTSYSIDFTKPAGQRISNVVIAGAPLRLDQTYTIAFNSFTASGGDAHEALKNAKGKRLDTGVLDLDAMIEYIRKHSPLNPKLEGRLKVAR